MGIRSVALFAMAIVAAPAQDLKFAELGDFKLASGEILRDCRIGYRTFGTLDDSKSNTILFPTWAGGTTEQLKSAFGPGATVDLSGYYVVTVDALGNGVSSSPSNSRQQPRMKFPKFTIRDMVETQHELLTKVLHVDHVKAVIGISMGGMQTFQWMVSYPGFMDMAIPMVGSPRLAPYDLMLWQTQIDAIVHDAAWQNGDYTVNPASLSEAEFGALVLTTPEHYNQHTTRAEVRERLKAAKPGSGGSDANNKIRQVEAMMSLDVSEGFGGSLEAAAKAVRAKVLIVVARADHVVTPQPALEFAKLLNAPTLILDGECGHSATGCEAAKIRPAVSQFLGR